MRFFWPALLALILALPAAAGDGRIEINQTCALTDGCFPGDTGGFPVTITEPGSYVLTGPLKAVVTGMNGVTINADDVSLDLNGFAIDGDKATLGGVDGVGILVIGIHFRLHVRNGMIQRWNNQGINAVNTSNAIFEKLRISDNGLDGLISNDAIVILDSTADLNGDDGFDTDDGCTIKNSTASQNGNNGIEGDVGCVVAHSTGSLNGGSGIMVGEGGLIVDSTGRSNSEYGIRTNAGSRVQRVVASLNGMGGIRVTRGSAVVDSTARNNTSEAGCVDLCCGSGIRAIQTDVLIRNNTADQNDGPGICTTANAVRIDGNHVTDNPVGIAVGGIRSLIIRNTAAGNTTDYNIGPGNSAGPIAGNPAVTTNPYANFELF